MDPQGEITEGQPEIPQGVWFKPFVGYNSIPYDFDRGLYKGKHVVILIQDIGRVRIESIWDREQFEEANDSELGKKVLYFDGKNSQVITMGEILDIEGKDEVRIVDVASPMLDISELNPSRTYTEKVRLPNGVVTERKYTDDEWTQREILGTQEAVDHFAVPETEFILGQIEMSISVE